MTEATTRVPAPMREEVNESAQPLDLAWTIRTDGIRVPAPMREDDLLFVGKRNKGGKYISNIR